MNIPSLSACTIQRDIASGPFSIGANIQVSLPVHIIMYTCKRYLQYIDYVRIILFIFELSSVPPPPLSLSLFLAL